MQALRTHGFKRQLLTKESVGAFVSYAHPAPALVTMRGIGCFAFLWTILISLARADYIIDDRDSRFSFTPSTWTRFSDPGAYDGTT